ncbi:MAG: aminotransferase class V-fold PLP-dependent enzyme [Opitutaceae bacterium]|nr:aminotransferase class V-fold PLP-dependent enzyme [Opitutaceae bacterium]
MSDPAPEKLFSPALQPAVRERFLHADGDPFTGPRAYLENAGGGLTLKAVFAADQRVGALPDNAGRDNPASREVGRAIQAGRADVATFLGAPAGTILSEQSTTACAFRLLEAAALGRRGGNLVCSQLDHASFYDAAGILAARHGLERRVAPLNRATGALDPDAVAALVDADTAAVTVIHASNITGGRTDLAAVAARVRARAPQAMIIADGAQHAQHGLVDAAGCGVDAYVFSAYKIFSKPGFAFACLSERLAARPHAQLAGKAAADWDLGTRDPGGFAAFSAVVDYLCWLGAQTAAPAPADRRGLVAAAMHAIEAHEAALSRRLLHGADGLPGLLAHARVTLHGQRDHRAGREAVFAFSVAGAPTGRLVQEFGRRGVILHDRVSDAYSGHTLAALGVREVVRVSLAHYNTPAEVDAFLRALRDLLAPA